MRLQFFIIYLIYCLNLLTAYYFLYFFLQSHQQSSLKMESALLIRPTAKKICAFPRSYPFPIIKDESNENAPFNCIIGHIKDQCVEITDQENIKILFTMGFFGKGTLSRSTPQALEESLMLKTKGYRKKKRSWQKSKETSPQKQSEDNEVEVVVCDDNEEENPSKKRKTDDEIEVVLSDTNDESEESNASPPKETPKRKEKETLQLTFEEAYFLSYGLGCLVVKDKDQPLDLMRLWHKLCELHSAQNFPVMYTAYHHFRSKGWIVRNGLKYGTDFVLYKDGPPFSHSSYAVIVKGVKEKGLRDVTGPDGRPNFSWSALAGLNRTITHASKGVLLLYVIKPGTISENKISTPFCVSQYKLEEVILKRWVPCENRSED